MRRTLQKRGVRRITAERVKQLRFFTHATWTLLGRSSRLEGRLYVRSGRSGFGTVFGSLRRHGHDHALNFAVGWRRCSLVGLGIGGTVCFVHEALIHLSLTFLLRAFGCSFLRLFVVIIRLGTVDAAVSWSACDRQICRRAKAVVQFTINLTSDSRRQMIMGVGSTRDHDNSEFGIDQW